MKIFYFTGTGNSLQVAKRFQGELISIPQALKTEQTVYEDEAIGIVFPIYYMNPPKMVREFLSKTQFKTEYLFAVGTYGRMCGAAMPGLQKTVKTYGYQFDYMRALLMVDNFLPGFEIQEEIAKIPEKKVTECLEQIVLDVNMRKHDVPTASKKDTIVFTMGSLMRKHLDNGQSAKKFLIDEKCSYCGLCEKICPAANISVSDRVNFGNQCESCYACIHACPQNAIHLKNEKSEKRWRNPDVTLAEIIRSNQ